MQSAPNYFRPTVTEHFSGGHIPVPESESPKQPQPAPRLALEPALEILSNVTIELELRDELITTLRDIALRCNELLERSHIAHRETLRSKHKAIVTECRQQSNKITELLTSMGKLESSLRTAAEKSGKARLLVVAAERSSPAPESYPSEQEKQNYALKLHKLRENLTEAEENESGWNRQYANLAREVREAQGEMATLAQRELELRSALSGEPVRSKEFGLWTPPEFVR